MLIDSCQQTFEQCLEILKKKNKDYGSVSNEWKNFEACLYVAEIPVTLGILIRIGDKISRISNLLMHAPSVTEESIEDTINDAINYLAILKARRQFDINGD
jgi:hypothetical protein